MADNCPHCGSTKIREVFAESPLGLENMPQKYRGYHCENCSRFFREKI